MAKKAIIILAEGFEEIEAVSTIDILRRAGIEVTVAGLDNLKVQGSRGITIMADTGLDKAGSNFDVCVLPGGMPGATHLSVSKDVIELVRKLNREKKIIAAICASPAVVLSRAGVLKNKNATCHPDMQAYFGQETNYKTDSVVIDGNIITSQGVATALIFSLAIVEKLLGTEIVEKVKKGILLN
jgi:4-methyl-5(b-hydroxyethyl)-thiazole monophosphate biosynthesis